MAVFRTFLPEEHPIPFVHRLLLTGVAPRPIALVGTVDEDGRPNVSPFSFFNAFGANPPCVAISPANRGSDGSRKHTFFNIEVTGEFTVSAVTWSLAEQVSLASSDYARGVSEFEKAGLTPRPSLRVRPPSVLDSPFSMECRLLHRISLGEGKGSGNLLVGEVLCFHIDEAVLHEGRPDPQALDLVGRCGGDYYVRASGDALFALSKPRHAGIGFDALPSHLLSSAVLTGAELARLAGVAALPDPDQVRQRWLSYRAHPAVLSPWLREGCEVALGLPEQRDHLHELVRQALASEDLDGAWDLALLPDLEATEG